MASLPPSKRRRAEVGPIHLSRLPNQPFYTRSYMHQAPVTHLAWDSSRSVLLSASEDGVLKLWNFDGNEGGVLLFLRQFRVFRGAVAGMYVDTGRAVVVAEAGVVSFVDLGTVDLTAVVRVGEGKLGKSCAFMPNGEAAVGSEEGKVGVIGVEGGFRKMDVGHRRDIVGMGMVKKVGAMVSVDEQGMVEYWKEEEGRVCKKIRGLGFHFKTETDLYRIPKRRTQVECAVLSPDGEKLIIVAEGTFTVFNTRSGKIISEWVERDLDRVPSDKMKEFGEGEAGRRMAREREIVRLANGKRLGSGNVAWDESGLFAMYGTLFGIKIVSVSSGNVVRTIGDAESSERFTALVVCGHSPGKLRPQMKDVATRIVAAAWQKSRIYIFAEEEEAGGERDVYNERPSRAGLKDAGYEEHGRMNKSKLAQAATLHTSMGDIKLRLFAECEKTVENFVTLCRDGKFDNMIFHRVIDDFMVQTGDYEFGDGTGGVSCWGGTFEDEFFDKYRFDRPGTLGMANAGPATNGSQFFITTVATPHLDKKHTVFGRVVKGMNVVLDIQKVKTDKNDKPLTDVCIISVSVHQELSE